MISESDLFSSVLLSLSALMLSGDRGAIFTDGSLPACTTLQQITMPHSNRMFVIHFFDRGAGNDRDNVLYSITEARPVCCVDGTMNAYRYRHTKASFTGMPPSRYMEACRKMANEIGGRVYYEIPVAEGKPMSLTIGSIKKIAREISSFIINDQWVDGGILSG